MVASYIQRSCGHWRASEMPCAWGCSIGTVAPTPAFSDVVYSQHFFYSGVHGRPMSHYVDECVADAHSYMRRTLRSWPYIGGRGAILVHDVIHVGENTYQCRFWWA